MNQENAVQAVPRVVSHFSCGAPSAVGAKLAIAQYGHDRVVIVNAFIEEEESDNRRFLADCEKWLNHEIVVLRDIKYNASTHEVWRRKRFIKGPHGAPCSMHLKREVLSEFTVPGDIEIIGYTAEEWDRLEDLRTVFPARRLQSTLIDKSISKDDCFAIITRAGLTLPRMYQLGYQNANCPGCPKGGQIYWQNIREDFPEKFVQIQTIQKEIGPGAYFLRFRSGPRKGERMSLAELPPGRGDLREAPSISCSFFCDMAEQDIAGAA